VSADGVICLIIIVRLLLIQQPGNTHGIYRSGQIAPTDPFVHSPFPHVASLT